MYVLENRSFEMKEIKNLMSISAGNTSQDVPTKLFGAIEYMLILRLIISSF